MRLLYFLKNLTAIAGECIAITCGIFTYIYHIDGSSLDCCDIIQNECEFYLLQCDVVKYEQIESGLGFVQHNITVKRKEGRKICY